MWFVYIVPIVWLTYVSGRLNPPNAEDDAFWNLQAKDSIYQALLLQANNNIARNVILFLGDGMGVPTVTAARILKGQKQNHSGEETVLEFEKFPYVALSKTYNVDRQVADSAGTATAFLSGVKAHYETLGVGTNAKFNVCETEHDSKITSILTWAQEAGKSTGVVTTTRITHATPAAAYAHSVNRYWEFSTPDPACKDLVSQMVEDNPGKSTNVFFGGGRSLFYPENRKHPITGEQGRRKDGKDLLKAWTDQKESLNLSSSILYSKSDLDNLDVSKTDYVLGLFTSNHLTYETNRDPKKEPSLAEMTAKAIQILDKNKKGYFLMVEGGRIDHAHHDNYVKRALEETLAMEEAVKVAMNMTQREDTLVVVTADHSHGMTINGYPERGTDILGLGDVSDVDKMPYTTLMYTTGMGYNYTGSKRPNLTGVDLSANDYRPLAAVPNELEVHGGEDVAIYATGPMAHLFHGVHEQNYVAHVMAYAACIGPGLETCINAPHPEPSKPQSTRPRQGRRSNEPNQAATFNANVVLLVFMFILFQGVSFIRELHCFVVVKS